MDASFSRRNISGEGGARVLKWSTYLERGRNMDPSMNTAPDRRMYQQEAISPRLEEK